MIHEYYRGADHPPYRQAETYLDPPDHAGQPDLRPRWLRMLDRFVHEPDPAPQTWRDHVRAGWDRLSAWVEARL